MTKVKIDAILWRSYLAATSSALWGLNNSQYYFELPEADPDYVHFFGAGSLPGKDVRGNDTYTIQLHEFDGGEPVGPYQLHFVKLRAGVGRAGNWQVLNQRDESAYPLWRKGRGPQQPFQQMTADDQKHNFAIIARDVNGGFHGRWIRRTDFVGLPTRVKQLLSSTSVGWGLL